MNEGGGRRRAVIYVRVSSVGRRDRESQSYQTETEQRERCQAYATARGLEVVGTHSDVDVSGAKWDREGLDAVLELARGGAIDAVIVYRLSRLGRGLRGILDTVSLLADEGVDLMSVNEGLDLSTAAGRLTFNLLASVDEYERELRGEYWEATKRRARGRGVLIGPTPFGYARDEGSRLVPDPKLAPVVVQAFEMRAKGKTFGDIGAVLDRAQPSRTGRPRLPKVVRGIIANPVYRGQLPQGAGECVAIVTPEQWAAAQTPVRPRLRKGSHHFILTGVATCATCGGPMVGDSFGGAARDTPVYVCRNRSRPLPERCPAPSSIVAHRVEPWVLHLVRPVIDGSMRAAVDEAGRLAELDEAADEAAAAYRLFAGDMKTRAKMGEEDWHEVLDMLIAERDRTAELAAEAREQAADGPGELHTWSALLADPDEMRRALRRAVSSLTVARGRGTVDERCDIEIRL
jgi:DNA invertase Pin-like site-specific DNA recombinase